MSKKQKSGKKSRGSMPRHLKRPRSRKYERTMASSRKTETTEQFCVRVLGNVPVPKADMPLQRFYNWLTHARAIKVKLK